MQKSVEHNSNKSARAQEVYLTFPLPFPYLSLTFPLPFPDLSPTFPPPFPDPPSDDSNNDPNDNVSLRQDREDALPRGTYYSLIKIIR